MFNEKRDCSTISNQLHRRQRRHEQDKDEEGEKGERKNEIKITVEIFFHYDIFMMSSFHFIFSFSVQRKK